MIRRFAVCVLVGALGLGVAPRPAFAARDRVVTGNHYRCMYHCDQRAHLFEDTPPAPTSRPRSLAQTTINPPTKSSFCQRAAPDPNNPPANPPTLADRILSWLYSAFCTSPTAQPAPAPLPGAGPPPSGLPPAKPPPPVGPPPVKPPPPVGPPPVKPPPAWPPTAWPPTGGQPGGWPHFIMPWPQSHGPFWSDPWDRWDHEDPWGDDDRWDHRKRRDHDDDDREHRKDRHRDDDDRREHREGRHHDDDDGPAHRHHPRYFWDF